MSDQRPDEVIVKRKDNFFDESALYDCQKAISRMETYLLNDWIVLLATDFQCYSNEDGKFIVKRRVHQYLYCLLGWFTFIRFFLGAIIKDPSIWVLIGDPFYLTENHTVFNLLIAMIGLNSSVFRTLLLIGEYQHKLEFIDDFSRIKPGQNHGLDSRSLRKLAKRFRLCNLVLFKVTPIYASISFGSVIAAYMLYAYLKQDYPYTLIVCVLWTILFFFLGWLASSIQSVTYGLSYLSSYYLKLKFEQIWRMPCNNFASIDKIIIKHNELSLQTERYNKFFKNVMGSNYFLATIIANLFAYIGFYGKGNKIFRCIVGSEMYFTFLLIYLSVYTSTTIAKQASYFNHPFNSLIASDIKFSYRQKWKIVKFLEHISNRVIGIYCLDLFPFTNYNFLMYISSVVIGHFMTESMISEYHIV